MQYIVEINFSNYNIIYESGDNMEIFVARQPIFNTDNEVYGYEILYRSGYDNSYNCTDEDLATSSTIISSFFDIGINKLTNGHKAFINFTTNLLDKEIATILPKEHVIIEVLENINPDEKIIESLKNIKRLGYTIALDDFVFSEKFTPFLNLADIVKIDFLESSIEYKRDIVKQCSRKDIIFLAEKVDTEEEHQTALEFG